MAVKKISIEALFKQKNIFVPGSNSFRTDGFIFFSVILLLLTNPNPIIDLNFDPLVSFQKSSLILIGSAIFLALSSRAYARYILDKNVYSIKHYSYILFSRFTINIAIILFFFVVCMWVIILGGILNSPFASLLTISPIIIFVQLFDAKIDYDKIFEVFEKVKNQGKTSRKMHHKPSLNKFMYLFEITPALLVFLTIICGEILINKCNLTHEILKTEYEKIFSSNPINTLHYIVFCLSILIAIFGIIPDTRSRNFSEKILNIFTSIISRIFKIDFDD